MNKGNERLMAILVALRKLPRWALILITFGVIVILGIAMFLLLPQSVNSQGDESYLNSTGLAFGVFLKLGVVVVLIIGVAIVLRRWQTKGHPDQLKQINILETVHLSPHRSLYMISIDDHKVLIGATDQTITNLLQINSIDAISIAEQPKKVDDFSEVLEQAKTSKKQGMNK